MLHGSKYFAAKEFACQCGCGFGSREEQIAADLVHLLHVLRVNLAVPFVITSGARCVKHNDSVGGGKQSTHVPGVLGQCTPGYESQSRAADIDTSRWSSAVRGKIVEIALSCGARVGIADTFIHIDVESAPYYSEGLWNYSRGETSSN